MPRAAPRRPQRYQKDDPPLRRTPASTPGGCLSELVVLGPLHEVILRVGPRDLLPRLVQLIGGDVHVVVGVRNLKHLLQRLLGVESARLPVLDLLFVEGAVLVLIELLEVL